MVSFISDHPRYVFSNVIHAALLRAVRYSSTLEIFEKERRAIRLMLLYNGSVFLPEDSRDSLMVVSFLDIQSDILTLTLANFLLSTYRVHR